MFQLPSSIHPIQKDDLIRVGSINDGGYILTKELIQKTEFLLSFGLYFDWNFEKDFLEKTKEKIKIHAYDNTVNKRSFLKYTRSAKINVNIQYLHPHRKLHYLF